MTAEHGVNTIRHSRPPMIRTHQRRKFDTGGERVDISRMEAAFGRMESDISYIKRDVAELRTDLRTVKTELQAESSELRSELKADVAQLRSEMKADITQLRSEMKADTAQLKSEIKTAGSDIIQLKVNFAALAEKVAGLPTKGFVVTSAIGTVTALTAILVLLSKLGVLG